MIIMSAAGNEIGDTFRAEGICCKTKQLITENSRCPICKFDDDGRTCVPELCEEYIDARFNLRGRWELKAVMIHGNYEHSPVKTIQAACSVCHRMAIKSPYERHILTTFCPFCGAINEGARKNTTQGAESGSK